MKRLALMLALLTVLASAARAQISPGKLSRAHAKLEGNSHCLDCHDPKQGVSASKCLSCHEPLQRRVAAGKGLHARPEYRDCKICHVEHQGVDFELVWWGKPGRAAFDHAQTGQPLAGKHTTLACGQCHKQERSFLGTPVECAGCHKDVHRGEFAGRACSSCHSQQAWRPASSFDHATSGWPLIGRHADVACEKCHPSPRLAGGSAQPSVRAFRTAGRECAGCHKDAHRGELAGRACSDCHTPQAWRPAKGFDHAKSRWPLTGRHAQVACEKCHPRPRAAASGAALAARLFRTVAGQECARCHEDVHKARLGGACASCHTTSSWREVRTTGFDHDKTAYPLRGRHATVACEGCHRPGQSLRLPHARCSDCHRDAHGGELARRADQGRCESCHDVSSFRPALFGPPEHEKTAYPLTGAHLAVACSACHRRPGAASGLKLRIVSTRCRDCHADPHRGEFARVAGAGGCESCHTTGSWRRVTFDHAKSRFALDGAHARLACSGCHRPAERGTATLRLQGLPTACSGCHRDPHADQFAAAGQGTACERCHTSASFAATRFDHGRDASYRLDGAHARLACAACHKPETRNGQTFVRYKPLPSKCSACHATKPVTGGRP